MPYKANEARRHKIPRARYRVTNWPEYDRALQRRGSLTVWVTPEALAAWHPPNTGRRGRSPQYADLAIETGHLLRLAFGRPWRQTEGLLRSLTALLGVSVGVPDHTTFSRRSPGLALAGSLAQAPRTGPVHVVIDATGLQVHGAGEWLAERHGGRGGRGRRKTPPPGGAQRGGEPPPHPPPPPPHPPHPDDRGQGADGLAEGGRLRPALARGNRHVPLQGDHRSWSSRRTLPAQKTECPSG